MTNIKKRAERNGKVRRTIAKIEQTVAKLERMKGEYMKKAVDAKTRGETASYNLAKSGLNATLSQIKRAREMLLNIEITAELQKMGDTNADFLKGMSIVAKRISKLNKQSDFVKLQKEIEKALTGMEEAQAGLDGFLQNSDAAFAAISSSSASLSDEQIDKLIEGRVTEKELLMDEQIERLMGGVSAATNSGVANTSEVRISVGAESAAAYTKATAQPFPMPNGVFDFSAARPTSLTTELKNAIPDIPNGATMPMVLCATTSGDGEYAEFINRPNVLIKGENNRRKYLHRLICAQLATLSADKIKLVLVDLANDGLNIYNGVPCMSANTVVDAEGVLPTLDALNAELDRRYAMFAESGLKNIVEYNCVIERKMPYIVCVIDGYDKADKASFACAYSALARQAKDCGIFTVIAACSDDVSVPPTIEANTITIDSQAIRSVEAFDCEDAKRIAKALCGNVL